LPRFVEIAATRAGIIARMLTGLRN
jgi:hypothetical protein